MVEVFQVWAAAFQNFADFRPEYLPSALPFVFTIHHHCHTVSHKQQITMPMYMHKH